MLKRGFSKINSGFLTSRYYFNTPPDALHMLNNAKKLQMETCKKKITVNVNTDCYKCLEVIKKNNLDYLPVISDTNDIIGFLNKHDVKNQILWHKYEEEEDEKLRDEYRNSRIS